MHPPSQQAWMQALEQLSAVHPTIAIEIDTPHLFIFIGALQLALRHPKFPPYSRQVITRLIEHVVEATPNQIIKETINMGFDARYDT